MKHNPMKRLAINIVAILIVGVAAFLANRSYSEPKLTLAGIDLPKLRTLKIVDAKVDSADARVAVKISRDDVPADTVADILEIYRWGRKHFGEIKCGDKYPPELCRVGSVTILLLIERDVPTSEGLVKGYAVIAVMGLDQVQIDVLLDKDTVQPTTFTELVQYHQDVAQATQETGGFIQLTQTPPIFTGLK